MDLIKICKKIFHFIGQSNYNRGAVMKKPFKTVILSVAAAGVLALITLIIVSRPEIYVKIHFPNAEVLSVEHRPGAFMFYGSTIRYELYDTVNEFTFYQVFSDSTFPRPYNNAFSYDEYMETKRKNDAFLNRIANLYSGEYFTRYDLNRTGVYIFLKCPIYEDLRDLMTDLNALDEKIEYVLYSLPANVYEKMYDQNFKRLSSMEAADDYNSYCFELIEMFLGIKSTYFRVSDEATAEMFDESNTMIIRSGYEGAKGIEGLVHSKNFGSKWSGW